MSSHSAGLDAGEPREGSIIRFCGTPQCLISWETLVEDSDNPVVMGHTSGRYVFVNRAFADILGTTASQLIGTSLSDWFSPEFAAERLRLRQHVLSTARCVRTLDLVRGRRYLVMMHPVQGGAYDGCILATLAPRPPRQDEIREIYPLEHVDPGRLSALSRRELEILRLIGEGISQREIAEHLHRTVKTIEAHRASLGRKLGVKKNIQLVQIAIEAGLLDPNMSESGHWLNRTAQALDQHPEGEGQDDLADSPPAAR